MRLMKRLIGLVCREERHRVHLRIQVKTPDGQEKQFFTEDLSEGGFRAAVPIHALSGEVRDDLELDIVLEEEQPPARVAARPTWTKSMPDGSQQSGWQIARYVEQAHERISAFLKGLGPRSRRDITRVKAAAMLRKPFRLAVLEEAIHEALGG